MNIETTIEVIETVKKLRGRPVGSVDPTVVEGKKVYAQTQVDKLEARKTRILNDLKTIEDKITKHNVFINS